MTRKLQHLISLVLTLLILAAVFAPAAMAEDDAVAAVRAQLEAIDSLQTMQSKRGNYQSAKVYTPKKPADDPDNVAALADHEIQRTAYETYLADMFAARAAAQQAYDALTDAQKAQLDPSLVGKLTGTLGTVFPYSRFVNSHGMPVPLNTRTDAYRYQIIGTYESSNYLTQGYEEGSPDVPASIVIVDTSDGAPTWTPDGLYAYGQNNYDVTYCSDLITNPKSGTMYKRTNLEDSGHYSASAARHIRAIMENAYPYLTIGEMKDRLKAYGLDSGFVDSLNRSDLIAGVQMAIWAFSNMDLQRIGNVVRYGGTYDASLVSYMNPLHVYNNELWEWWPTRAGRMTVDPNAAYRVNNLTYFLCNLPPKDAPSHQLVISDVEITMARLVPGEDDLYQVGIYVNLNGAVRDADEIYITATSTHANGEESAVTDRKTLRTETGDRFSLQLLAQPGDMISVDVSGTQYLEKGVYYYEPENGRDSSQALVGVAEGETAVSANKTFVFEQDIEKGLRIIKTTEEGGLPISDITFDVYRIPAEDAADLGDTPTEEEVSRYATTENLVGAAVTDAVGYAKLPLEDDGVYLVIERDSDKIQAPVAPFYVWLPMPVTEEDPDTGAVTIVGYSDIATVYPKNVPVTPPDSPPDIPPPDYDVKGVFQIVKYADYDETKLLQGASFQVYRAAGVGEDPAETVILTVEGASRAAVPVEIGGAPLILTTGTDGSVTSPELRCGLYYLVETEAPVGYELSAEVFRATARQTLTGAVETVRIPNTSALELPSTGGPGTAPVLTLGAFLTLGAAALLAVKSRRRHSREA